jgi:hypothetical protein
MTTKDLIPFKKGDSRINRKGRPRSFDQLRKLAQSLSHEVVETAQGKMTATEVILRQMAKDPKQRELFLQYAYGKVPDKLELTGRVDLSTLTDHQLLRLKNGDNVLDVLADKS